MNPVTIYQSISNSFQLSNYTAVEKMAKQHFAVILNEPNIAQMVSVSLRRLNKYDQAKKWFIKSIKTHPLHVPLLNSYGNFLLDLKEYNASKLQFQKAISIESNHFNSYLNLGRLHLKLNEYSKALTNFKHAARLKPASSEAIVGCADSYRSLGDIVAAENIYFTALQQGSSDIKVLSNLASIRRHQNRFKEAITLLKRTLIATPNELTSLRNIAACLALDNQTEDAIKHYRQIVTTNPFDVDAQGELARLLWSLGINKPFQYIQAALGSVSENVEYWIWFIGLLMEAEEYELATGYIETLLEAHPNVYMAISYSARIQRVRNDIRCIATSKRAIKASKQPNNTGLLNELGYSLLAFQKNAEALGIYSRLTKIDEMNQGWWTLLSTCYKRLGNAAKYEWLCNYSNLVSTNNIEGAISKQGVLLDIKALKLELQDMHNTSRHPIGQSLRGGTQTFENLFDNQLPQVQALKEIVLEYAQKFISKHKVDRRHPFLSRVGDLELSFVGSWSVSLKSNGFHKSHFHPQGWLSGVFYIDLPLEIEDEGQGWLQLGKPEIENDQSASDLLIKPEPGVLVLFPSYIWHGTLPFFSSTQRLTIAFDFEPKKTLRSSK
jgi:tetratricopeptide (TPR) repeat protein